MHHPFIIGENVYFRCIDESDVESPYLDWLNDEEVTRFLTTVGHFPVTKEYLLHYIQSMAQSDQDILFAIHDVKTNEFIGTSHFGPVNWLHRTGTFGIMIGNKEFWGKGYGTEVFFHMTDYGFRRLNLHKISVGAVSEQVTAIKYMNELGYTQEGTLREEFFYNGKYIDGLKFGLLEREFFDGPYGNGWPKTKNK